MRLFIALDIDEHIRTQIARFLEEVRGFAPEARWVRPESLHVTFKFIGEKAEHEAEKIAQLLKTLVADEFDFKIRGLGFFPGARTPRVFWAGIEAVLELTLLESKVDEVLATLSIPKEEHPFHPHLTLARGKEASRGSRKKNIGGATSGLLRLKEKLAGWPTPEFGRMTAREFFLYKSQSLPGGSKYTKLARFALRQHQS